MLAIFRFTAHLNDCRTECFSRHCTFALSLFSLLRHLPHVKRSLIGQLYDHAANMNSESAKELLKLQNSVLVCRQLARGKVCDFFMTVALQAIPPLTEKNRPLRLFGHLRLIGRIRYLSRSTFLLLSPSLSPCLRGPASSSS